MPADHLGRALGPEELGLNLVKRIGAKKAHVAVTRKLACILLRLWKDESHFQEGLLQSA